MRRGAPSPYYKSPSMTLVNNAHDDIEGGQVSVPLVRTPTSTAPSSASQMEISLDVSGKGKGPRIKSRYYSALSRQSPNLLRMYGLVLFIGTAILMPMLSIEWCILLLVFSSCAFGAIASLWLSRVVLQCDDGTNEMRQVSDPIREGASGFLKVQYSVSYSSWQLLLLCT